MTSAPQSRPSFFRRAAGLLFRWFAPGSEGGRESAWRKLKSEAVRAADNKQPFEAEKKLQQALQVADSFGETDWRRLESLDCLAAYYESTGSYSQAEPLYRQVLEIRERELGSDHFEVGQSLNNLALLHYTQGKDDLAEPLFRRLIRLIEKARGPEDRELAVCLENYAALLRRLGRSPESDRLRARAKEIRDRGKEAGGRRQEAGRGRREAGDGRREN